MARPKRSRCREFPWTRGRPSRRGCGRGLHIRRLYWFGTSQPANSRRGDRSEDGLQAGPGMRLATGAKTPRTVFVFPTSMTRSIGDVSWCVPIRRVARNYFSLTVPLKTICSPFAVRTCRKPRGSRPSVVPSNAEPFSSIRTSFPRTQEELSQIDAESSRAHWDPATVGDIRGRVILAKRPPNQRATIRCRSRAAARWPRALSGRRAWFTLMPMPTTMWRTRVASAFISVRMPQNFLPSIKEIVGPLQIGFHARVDEMDGGPNCQPVASDKGKTSEGGSEGRKIKEQ